MLLFESIGTRREGINGRKTPSTRGAYKREVIGRGLKGVGVGSLGSWVVETELTISDNCMTDDFYS